MEKIIAMGNISLNCNDYSVYDYKGYSLQELLNIYYTKINEIGEKQNEVIDVVDFLVGQGVNEEVARQIQKLLEDGTLETIINQQIFGDLDKKIDDNKIELDTKFTNITNNINNEIDTFKRLDIREFGIKESVLDQTPLVKSILGNITTECIIHIPPGIRFDPMQVYPVVKKGVILEDFSLSSYKSDTYRIKNIGYVSPGDTEENDGCFKVTSGHHPAILMNNYNYANSTSSNKSYNTIVMCDGFRQSGEGFIDDSFMLLQGGKNTTNDKYRFSIRAQKLCLDQNNRVDSTIMELLETGDVTFGSTIMARPKSYGGNAKALLHSRSDTDSAQVLMTSGTKNLILSSNIDGSATMHHNGVQQYQYNDNGSLSIKTSEVISNSKETTNVIDCTNKRYISVALASANSIQLNNMLDYQIVTLFFENANATLSKTAFKLKGNVDYTPTQFSSITFLKRNNLTSLPIEIGRCEL